MSYVERLFALTGQNTVVIGGSGVLGSAMSEGLARAGANVAILGRNLKKAQRQAERLKAYGVSSLAIQMEEIA